MLVGGEYGACSRGRENGLINPVLGVRFPHAPPTQEKRRLNNICFQIFHKKRSSSMILLDIHLIIFDVFRVLQ